MDQEYGIASSTDLASWSEIDDFKATGPSSSYTQAGVPASVLRRYYRIELR